MTCILAHKDGHSEETTLTAPPDTSGSKNAIQSTGSSVTYLKRYTLEAVTGIVTSDDDNDGGAPLETITETQQAEIKDMIEANDLNMVQLMKKCKVNSLSEIHERAYKGVKDLISQAIRNKDDNS